jgi:hypothetical protein
VGRCLMENDVQGLEMLMESSTNGSGGNAEIKGAKEEEGKKEDRAGKKEDKVEKSNGNANQTGNVNPTAISITPATNKAFMFLVHGGKIDELRAAVIKFDVRFRNHEDQTAFHLSAFRARVDVLELLEKRIAEEVARVGGDQNNVKSNDKSLSQKKDSHFDHRDLWSAQDANGDSPLHIAAFGACVSEIKFIMNKLKGISKETLFKNLKMRNFGGSYGAGLTPFLVAKASVYETSNGTEVEKAKGQRLKSTREESQDLLRFERTEWGEIEATLAATMGGDEGRRIVAEFFGAVSPGVTGEDQRSGNAEGNDNENGNDTSQNASKTICIPPAYHAFSTLLEETSTKLYNLPGELRVYELLMETCMFVEKGTPLITVGAIMRAYILFEGFLKYLYCGAGRQILGDNSKKLIKELTTDIIDFLQYSKMNSDERTACWDSLKVSTDANGGATGRVDGYDVDRMEYDVGALKELLLDDKELVWRGGKFVNRFVEGEL